MGQKGLVVCVVLMSSLAHAETTDPSTEADAAPVVADDPLIEQGQELAKQGEFSRAIQLFKQADAKHPTAAHACLIGLVYTRRELWSQAEIFFDRCHKRATAADPVPDWLSAAELQLVKKLSEVDAAPIEIHVLPENVASRIVVSSFPSDEQFEPRVVHLAPGTYVVTATAPDREPATVSLTVVPRTAQIVTLVLPRPPPPPPPPPTRDERIGRILLIGAAGVAIAGGGFHLLASYERGKLDDAARINDPVEWDHHRGSFEHARAITIGCYAAAAIAGTIGIVMSRHHREGPVVTAGVGHGVATIGVEWRR
jgi:hypothetical protein